MINNDIRSYRQYSISQYNNNEERGTDEFCFRKFLNEYTTAINVFGLHQEMNCKGSFNKFINASWCLLKCDIYKLEPVGLDNINKKEHRCIGYIANEIKNPQFD